jgi:hypothetical protein
MAPARAVTGGSRSRIRWHPHHALLEEAITIDFVNSALGPAARVAVELTLEAAKELVGALARAIAAAEDVEGARHRAA